MGGIWIEPGVAIGNSGIKQKQVLSLFQES